MELAWIRHVTPVLKALPSTASLSFRKEMVHFSRGPPGLKCSDPYVASYSIQSYISPCSLPPSHAGLLSILQAHPAQSQAPAQTPQVNVDARTRVREAGRRLLQSSEIEL